jgi:hypothetical protein
MATNDPPAGSGLSRRQVLESLAGALGAGLVIPGTAAAHPIQEHLKDPAGVAAAQAKAAAPDGGPAFLGPHEFETFSSLAEQIVPGSKRAGVGPFVNALLAVDNQEHQERFLAALSALERESLARYNHPWVSLTPPQQVELLQAASVGESSHEPRYWKAGESVPVAEPAQPPRTLRDHFDELKGWVAGAYYTSEVGLREVGWTGNLFFASFPACEHPEGHGG